MGYSVYEDYSALDYGIERWAGYGVPAVCDLPECNVEIDRGMAYNCRENSFSEGVGKSCGLYFCEEHLYDHKNHKNSKPKPDTFEWEQWILTDDSWAEWRANNPDKVKKIRARLSATNPREQNHE